MLPPIPRDILIHSATKYTTTKDRYGKETISASAPITFIRCEPVSEWKQANIGEMKDDKLLMFYDCVNSLPAGLSFAKGDKVEFNGQDYTVRSFKDFSPHHLEINLK